MAADAHRRGQLGGFRQGKGHRAGEDGEQDLALEVAAVVLGTQAQRGGDTGRVVAGRMARLERGRQGHRQGRGFAAPDAGQRDRVGQAQTLDILQQCLLVGVGRGGGACDQNAARDGRCGGHG
ncbi:Uncharacterised protein [Bordetella pertussis]|nr:Uncharacterised protein [Bordetella pertussis]